MRSFVTGATGFLGRFLCQALVQRGDDVVAVGSKECNLTKQDSLAKYSEKFDRIYHLACWTQAGDFCLRHPGEQWIINQQINTNVLNWWQHSQPQAKLVTLGTSCSYDANLPLIEENYMQGEPIESLFTYGMTKRMLYAGCKALNKQYHLDYLYLIPSTLYGPGYHTDGRQLHFIFDLIRKILNGKYQGDPVTLWGDGHQKRELIHVNDFVSIMMELEKSEERLYNIGGGEEHSIREFASIICKHVGYSPDKIEYDTSKYVGARSKVLSIEKIRNLGLTPQTPLENGLMETIDWFSEAILSVNV